MTVTVTLAFSIKPGRLEEFNDLLKNLPPDTRAFEGRQKAASTKTGQSRLCLPG